VGEEEGDGIQGAFLQRFAIPAATSLVCFSTLSSSVEGFLTIVSCVGVGVAVGAGVAVSWD